MLRTDAVVGTAKPSLKIGEHEVNDGQKGFRDVHVAALRDGCVKISAFSERRIAAPIVGNNRGARRHGAFDEACQRLCAPVRHHGEPDAPGVTPGLSLVEAAGALALSDFDGACHEHHIVDTTSFATRASSNPCFVGFDDFIRLAADPVLVGAHHTGTQLVKNLESGFVARQPELTLELDSRHAGCLTGNQVRTPKPDRKWRVRAFHDRARSKTGVTATMTAAKHLEARSNVPWLISHRAVRADEAISPSGTLKILCTRSFIWEQALKLRKRVGERKFFSLKYVDNHVRSRLTIMPNILPLVSGCDNPISTVQFIKRESLEMTFKPRILAASLAAIMPCHFALAADEAKSTKLEEVVVSASKIETQQAIGASSLDASSLAPMSSSTSDTASLLRGVPGVSLYGAGGVSSLPVIHGMADDRLRVQVDGMDLISACSNHMNPPLSYIDPSSVGSIQVFAGIAPVSVGGDSIGGTIQVNSAAPEFAAAGQGTLLKGQAGGFYRSNGNAQGGNVSATIAGEKVGMSYSGSTVESGNYKAGGDFKAAGPAATGREWLAGDEVGSSRYKSENQSLGFALRHENHLVELKFGFQHIPEQGFPNQRMDMTDNESHQVNLHYNGQYQWGALEARVYDENTRHKMNFGDDKMLNPNPTGMPMDTEGKNTGARVKADIVLSERDILRVGGEYQRYRLNDWWSPSGTGGMSPNTFWNINDGQRDRFDAFAEWEARWSPQWVSQLGVRSDTVKMNTGTVQGYKSTGAVYPAVAAAFNALDRQRTDDNIDLTALARYTPDTSKTFEAGYAMKTRSPNLYERYTWSTQSTMVLNMNNWFGDGNGYVGNVDLKPEVAHTLSVTGSWHDAAQEAWELKVSPYYTRVENYIDAIACPAPTCAARTDGFVNLSLANQSARLYGADVSGRMPLVKVSGYGSFTATGVVSYVNGKNQTTGDNLYNVMPLNAKLAIVQRLGNWTNTLESYLVDAKTNVQAVRKEIKTGGYGLLNLRSSYEWKQVRLDIGIENALNKFYVTPLGGAYVGQGSTMSTGIPYGTLVPGIGRSIYTGLTVKF